MKTLCCILGALASIVLWALFSVFVLGLSGDVGALAGLIVGYPIGHIWAQIWFNWTRK